MARAPQDLTDREIEFLTARHLATLTTLRADGSPHVVPVGFTFDPGAGVARVICSDGTQKVRNIERLATVVLCQIAGAAWLSLEGRARIARSPAHVAEGERRYTERYQAPRPNDRRVVIEIAVDRVLGRGPQ